MTFERAAELIPYLKQLGISHLYASPVFKAVSGSTHGYDVIDPNEIDPVLGGREGFDDMVEVLRRHDIGLILDIVPNHMAASLEYPRWRDVVTFGPESTYPHFFILLTLAFLAETFDSVLESGDLTLKAHPETRGFRSTILVHSILSIQGPMEGTISQFPLRKSGFGNCVSASHID